MPPPVSQPNIFAKCTSTISAVASRPNVINFHGIMRGFSALRSRVPKCQHSAAIASELSKMPIVTAKCVALSIPGDMARRGAFVNMQG